MLLEPLSKVVGSAKSKALLLRLAHSGVAQTRLQLLGWLLGLADWTTSFQARCNPPTGGVTATLGNSYDDAVEVRYLLNNFVFTTPIETSPVEVFTLHSPVEVFTLHTPVEVFTLHSPVEVFTLHSPIEVFTLHSPIEVFTLHSPVEVFTLHSKDFWKTSGNNCTVSVFNSPYYHRKIFVIQLMNSCKRSEI